MCIILITWIPMMRIPVDKKNVVSMHAHNVSTSQCHVMSCLSTSRKQLSDEDNSR